MTTRMIIPTYQPTLADFKRHIRITTSDMDADLTAKLQAAIRSAEHYIGRIIAQSVFTYRGPYAKTITLESPTIAVNQVMVDGVVLADSAWTLAGDELTVDMEGETLLVEYVAGTPWVEPDIEAAVLLHAAALFENPVDSVETLPKASSRLLAPYRTWGVK